MSDQQAKDSEYTILIFGETSNEIKKNVEELKLETAEELVLACAKTLGIGPVLWHLFGLYHAPRNVWLCPNQKLSEWSALDKSYRQLQFRLRFKPGNTDKLKLKEDKKCFDYYFYQVRYDFHKNKYGNHLQGKILGLAVADVLRYLLTANCPDLKTLLDEAFSQKRIDWANFLPQQYGDLKFRITAIKRKELKSLLETAWFNCQKNVDFVKQEFIDCFSGQTQSDILPKYHTETYTAYFDIHMSKETQAVVAEFQPFNGNCLVVRMYRNKDSAENWENICSISELCFISVQMATKTVEISRRNGIPHYFTFENDLHLKSFVSLLDGYYRLTEKWSFSLCREISSPHLARLRLIKCHGPVNDGFVRKKLLEKSEGRLGTYLLRESNILFDEYNLDILIAENRTRSYRIELTQEGYLLENTNKIFKTLSELIHQFVIENGHAKLRLAACLPPSEFDNPENLLICKTGNASDSESRPDIHSDPRILSFENLQFDNSQIFSSNARYRVKLATWRKILKELVVVKEVVNEDDTRHFLETMSSWIHPKSECIVNFIGITMHSPLSLVMEYLQLGPLDEFLKKNQQCLKVVDLIESATYVARALWFLEENKLVHGLIRCHNLIVSSYTNTSLKVKLSDPLGVCDKYRHAPWIAPELMDNVLDAVVSASIASDTWAFGTTLWEIFSYGTEPSCVSVLDLFQPIACPAEVWKLMGECWIENPNDRKQPQSIVRDVRNIFYEVYNSRNINCYSTPYDNKCEKAEKRFFRSFLSKHASTLSLARSSVTSMTTLFTGIDSSRSDLVSLCSELHDPSAPAPTVSESWLIEANQLTLGKVLGQGCYGEVIKAVMTQWAGLKEEIVAVKRINSNVPDDIGLQDMRREIEIMKTLVHQNIVEIKGFVEDPMMMLVMEYVELGSLLTYLRIQKSKGFSEEEPICLIKFAADIAEGMEYLETKGIVHRDLAARNILVASPSHVKISDFGLAQFIDPKSNYYRMQTQRGLPLRWYAPESLKTFCFSHQSDVWSFGVTLWEMMSYGKDPTYPGEVKDEHLLDVLEKGIRLQCPDECPLEVYHVMLNCWKEETKRPSFTCLRQKFEDMLKAQ